MVELVYAVLILHFIADFLFQSDYMAKNKSKDIEVLTEHAIAYAVPFVIFFSIFYPIWGLSYVVFNVCSHFIIDYFTSKLNAKLWEKQQVHWFFCSVGFDQLLHTLILIGTIGLFLK